MFDSPLTTDQEPIKTIPPAKDSTDRIRIINSESGQQELAECITRAVKNYISWVEKQQQHNENYNTGVRTETNQAFLEAIDEKEKKGL